MKIEKMEKAIKLHNEYTSVKGILERIKVAKESCKHAGISLSVYTPSMALPLPSDLAEIVLNDIEHYFTDMLTRIENKFEEF